MTAICFPARLIVRPNGGPFVFGSAQLAPGVPFPLGERRAGSFGAERERQFLWPTDFGSACWPTVWTACKSPAAAAATTLALKGFVSLKGARNQSDHCSCTLERTFELSSERERERETRLVDWLDLDLDDGLLLPLGSRAKKYDRMAVHSG